jgi:predicted SprT family Zn-dependent metalloprotease
MDWDNALSLARTLMNEHGLGHVPLGAHSSKRYFGTTRFVGRRQMFSHPFASWEVKAIQLSKPLTEVNSETQVRDTILHEIAHAIAGPVGHSWQWKHIARQIGASPEAVCGKDAVQVPGPYQAECTCGQVHSMYRMPKRQNKICRYTRQKLEFRKVEL